MDPSLPSLEASSKVSGCSDRAEGRANALRDLATSFQIEISQQIEKFTGDMEEASLQSSETNVHAVGQRDKQLQKAELIIEIQAMVAFITSRLHEHQLMEKLDPKPSASHDH